MGDNRKKILFIILSLTGGGAERVLLNILKDVDRNKFIISLVLFEKKGVYLEQVPRDIKIYDLNKKNRFSFFELIFKLAYKIYPEIKPDIVVSFLGYANCITIISRIIAFVFKSAVIISEQNHRLLSLRFQRFKILKACLIKKLYPRADIIIAASKGVREDLINSFSVSAKKIRVIYNCARVSLIKDLSRQPVNDYFAEEISTIIACGRLTYQKNYPLLFQAFSKVLKENDARLLILGEGEEKNKLKSLANELGIQENVEFLGFKNNPFKYIAKSDIFVLSSLYEGFPNVIIEAMACGTAVVSTDCPSGPNEIITDGVNGLLVPVGDENAMAEAILKLIKDESLRRCLVESGRKRAEDFRVEKMVSEYEKVFEETESIL